MSTEPTELRRVRRVTPKRRANGADAESTLNLRELLRTRSSLRRYRHAAAQLLSRSDGAARKLSSARTKRLMRFR